MGTRLLEPPGVSGDGRSVLAAGGSVMLKVNTKDIVEITWSSPKGKFAGAGKEISEELGRKPHSTDLNDRHPFWCRR